MWGQLAGGPNPGKGRGRAYPRLSHTGPKLCWFVFFESTRARNSDLVLVPLDGGLDVGRHVEESVDEARDDDKSGERELWWSGEGAGKAWWNTYKAVLRVLVSVSSSHAEREHLTCIWVRAAGEAFGY